MITLDEKLYAMRRLSRQLKYLWKYYNFIGKYPFVDALLTLRYSPDYNRDNNY